MDIPARQYFPVLLGRGEGKTFLARAWARAFVKAKSQTGAHGTQPAPRKSLLVADFCGPAAEATKDFLRQDDPETFGYTRIHAATPQRDEFRIKGIRWDAAVCENIDMWPLVPVDPNDPKGPKHSVLMEEILAYTHGPIIFTFSAVTGLPALMYATTFR